MMLGEVTVEEGATEIGTRMEAILEASGYYSATSPSRSKRTDVMRIGAALAPPRFTLGEGNRTCRQNFAKDDLRFHRAIGHRGCALIGIAALLYCGLDLAAFLQPDAPAGAIRFVGPSTTPDRH